MIANLSKQKQKVEWKTLGKKKKKTKFKGNGNLLNIRMCPPVCESVVPSRPIREPDVVSDFPVVLHSDGQGENKSDIINNYP